MFKLILLGFAFYLVYILFFKKTNLTAPKNNDASSNDSSLNDMIACSSCHTYSAVEDMLIVDGRYYCCKECAKDAS